MMSEFEVKLSQICDQISEQPGIRFVGVINKIGKLVAGGFNQKVIPYVSDDANRELYMKHCLDITMMKDFDDFLGPIEYVSTRRKKITMITVPVQTYALIICAEPHVDAEKVAKLALDFFGNVF